MYSIKSFGRMSALGNHSYHREKFVKYIVWFWHEFFYEMSMSLNLHSIICDIC